MGADGVKKMLDSAGVGKAPTSVGKGKTKARKAKDPNEEPAKAYPFILPYSRIIFPSLRFQCKLHIFLFKNVALDGKVSYTILQ